MIKPKFWLNLVKQIGSKGSMPCLVCHEFCKGFFFNGVSGKKKKHFKPFLVVLFQRKIDFYQTKP